MSNRIKQIADSRFKIEKDPIDENNRNSVAQVQTIIYNFVEFKG